MATPTTEIRPAQLGGEVLAFAAERGLTPFLVPVLDWTRQVFAGVGAVRVADDPEIADVRHLAISVDVTGLGAEQIVNKREDWVRGLFQRCPSSHICSFVLDLEAVE